MSKMLGKWKTKQLKGRLGKFIVISKIWLTQILKTKKQRQQSYINTVHKSINQSHLIIFQIVSRWTVSPKKVHDNLKLYTNIAQRVIKFMSQKW
jgi:hypothetical protein